MHKIWSLSSSCSELDLRLSCGWLPGSCWTFLRAKPAQNTFWMLELMFWPSVFCVWWFSPCSLNPSFCASTNDPKYVIEWRNPIFCRQMRRREVLPRKSMRGWDMFAALSSETRADWLVCSCDLFGAVNLCNGKCLSVWNDLFTIFCVKWFCLC